MHKNSLPRAALLIMAAGVLFAAMGALVRVAASSLPDTMVVFFRSAFGLLFLWVMYRGLPFRTTWLPRHRGFGWLRTTRLRDHLVRGIAGVSAMYCFFYAIARMPLAEATLLNYSTPIFTPFAARLMTRERMDPRLWLPIGTGFAGLLCILKPGAALFTPVALIGLLSGVLAAVAMVGVRELSHTEPTERIVFWFTLTSTGLSAFTLPATWITPPVSLWPVLLLMGLTASIAQLLMTKAYAYAPAAQIGPFTFSTVVFAAVIAWVAWSERPDGLSVAGALLVVMASWMTLRRAGEQASPVAED